MSGLGTPQYSPPPVLASQGFNSFDQEDPPQIIDPSLINPPGTAPEQITPGALPSPEESSAFVLPPPVEDKKTKKKGLKKLGGLGDSFRGGFSKVKGKFKKEPKIKESHSIEAQSEEDLAGSREYLDDDDYEKVPYPDVYESKSSDPIKQPSRLDNLKNLFKKPQDADPTPYQTGDVVELVDPVKSKSYITFGNFINVMLIAFIIAGIIMCACVGIDDTLKYIGPAALGLGFFALVGKIFFSLFWQDDPIPQAMKPVAAKTGNMLAPILGETDPYGLKSGRAYGMNTAPPVVVYLGPMSTSAAPSVMQMEQFSYPTNAPSKMYDESIDTRMREMSGRQNPYSEQPHPSDYQPAQAAVKTPW